MNAITKKTGDLMTKADKETKRISIEYEATKVTEQYGEQEVKSILWLYGAHCIDDLSPFYYDEVFGELMRIANDN